MQGSALFSLFINDLPASLLSFVSSFLYADDLAIWSSFSLVHTTVKAIQGALIRLERWSECWYLLLSPSKCEASFFLVDPHQANLQPNLLLFNSRFLFNSTLTFLGYTFHRTLFFSNHVFSIKASLVSKPSAVTLLPHGAPLRSPSLFCTKLFFEPFSLRFYPDGFLFLALPISPNWNNFTERLVALSPAAFRPLYPTSPL